MAHIIFLLDTLLECDGDPHSSWQVKVLVELNYVWGKENELKTVGRKRKSSGFWFPWRPTGLGHFVSLHGLWTWTSIEEISHQGVIYAVSCLLHPKLEILNALLGIFAWCFYPKTRFRKAFSSSRLWLALTVQIAV